MNEQNLIGRRIGPYIVESFLGAGGMGEVYRSRDTKLGRDVAIEVLPAAFTADAERVARFHREARSLATLNHPNIGAIYGFEDAGDIHAIVLELVEGETLDDRIRKAPIPVDEALKISLEIAGALDAAHEKGIIHRDLKPANIKITPDGTVKVLDFGLAKVVTGDASNPELTQSPTMTAGQTHDGVLLGTVVYMRPEQARGLAVDKRTDIWAFGCVLYEMLTGTRAFAGDSASDSLARVLMKEPDWEIVPASTPPTIHKLLRRCLAKDRRRRLSNAADVRLEIEDAQAAPSAAIPVPERDVPAWRHIGLFAVACGAAALIAGSGVWLATRPVSPRVTRFTITPTADAPLTLDAANRSLAISADGRRIVYAAANGTQLVVRALGQLVTTTLTGLGAPSQPVFSPDGQWVAFFDGANRLKKVAMAGGPAITLGPMIGPGGPGASWEIPDTIVYGGVLTSGLMRVRASGGEPEVLTTLDRAHGEESHVSPQVLPGGQAVLFTITTPTDAVRTQVAVMNLRTGARTILVRGGFGARYVSPGYLVYAAGGTLRAVAFDIASLSVSGAPVPVVEGVMTGALGRAEFDVSPDGTLIYVPGDTQAGAQRTLVWVDRKGQEEPLAAPPRAYVYPRLSPNGQRLAISVTDQQNDIWIWELSRNLPLAQFTFDTGMDLLAIWTPDGRRLVWGSARQGPVDIYWQRVDGTGPIERLTENGEYPMSISPDGSKLVLRNGSGNTKQDLMMLGLDAQRQVTPLIQTAFNDQNGEVSPDGRWIAYEADESGQLEIYVRPFPNVESGRWLVSTVGGRQPLWARSGRELFYRTLDGAVMDVRVERVEAVDRGAGFSVGAPKLLVPAKYYLGSGAFLGRTYDVSPDGRRFVMIKDQGAGGSMAPPISIVVVQNWVEELKRLVGIGRK